MTSRQPRFSENQDPQDVFASFMRIYENISEQPPPYSSDSRKRDDWLRSFVQKEPHLNGILSSVNAIDKNRGWSVVGSKRQVDRITEMLHNFTVAPGLRGWRSACGFMSSSFWGSNMGAVIEIGRDGMDGPPLDLYTVDPAKCTLSGDPSFPLKYHPKNGKIQKWREEDFIRVTSTPSTVEEYNGLGQCAVDRSVQIALIMIALFRHEEEQLGARAPTGLLLLSGIKRDQWEKAMQARSDEMDYEMDKYFGSVAVLASASSTVEAKLVALSQLPKDFGIREWMDMTMYGYSLCFGYDPSEFWPVQYGALGRGNETQIQHEKATGKGRLEFVLGFQEQFQSVIPKSVDFMVEQRDDQGDLLHASVNKAWTGVVSELYTSSDVHGVPLITNEEARVKLAEYGVIPSTWSPTAKFEGSDIDDTDDDEVTDDQSNLLPVEQSLYMRSRNKKAMKFKYLRESLMEKDSVLQAARRFPKEPIVQYSYPANTILELWSSGEDLLSDHVWVVQKRKQNKQTIVDEEKSQIPQQILFEPHIQVNLPEQKQPEITINVPERTQTISFPEQKAPIVNVATPEVKITNQAPKIDVNIPPQIPPTFIVNVPEQAPPTVTVNSPDVNVMIPEQVAPVVNVQAAQVPDIIVNVPAQEPPVVNVSVPAQEPPIVNVSSPEVNINNEILMPEEPLKSVTVSVTRGPDGKIKSMTKEEEIK